MKRNATFIRKFEENAKKHGIGIAGPDHPAYSEEPSIMFLHRTSDSSSKKAIDSRPENSQTSSDTPTKKQDS